MKKPSIFKVKRRAKIKKPLESLRGYLKETQAMESLGSKVYKKVSNKDVGRLVKRAYAITKQLDEVKPLYNELDQITHALLNVDALKKRNALERYGVSIVDQFAAKNTVFRNVGVQRFKLNWLRK